MGRVVDLGAYRERRRAALADPIARLERAVRRLDAILAHPSARRHLARPEVEAELRAINAQVSMGLAQRAAERIERLIAALERGRAGTA